MFCFHFPLHFELFDSVLCTRLALNASGRVSRARAGQALLRSPQLLCCGLASGLFNSFHVSPKVSPERTARSRLVWLCRYSKGAALVCPQRRLKSLSFLEFVDV